MMAAAKGPPLDTEHRLPRLVPRQRARSPPSSRQPETPAFPVLVPSVRQIMASGTPTGGLQRRILCQHDLDVFQQSGSCTLLRAFVFSIADAVRGRPAAPASTASTARWPAISAIVAVLEQVEGVLETVPPHETGGSRFGNAAFRQFVDALRPRARGWHAQIGVGDDALAVVGDELAGYFLHSFGSPDRLDYGSGHELHFVCWLLCLQRLGLLPPEATATASAAESRAVTGTRNDGTGNGTGNGTGDGTGDRTGDETGDRTGDETGDGTKDRTGNRTGDGTGEDGLAAVGLVVFWRYLRLARRIQAQYYLEPAGSHGVWGLDDHQFLPFLFGAAQLDGHAFLTPRCVRQPLLLEQFGRQYLYLDQVAFVSSVKTVDGMRWHSPMLDDISAARSWAKIAAGMRRLFLHDVLAKLPVMQHFLFGALLPLVLPRERAAAGAAPDATASDAVAPDAVAPDAVAPDAVAPDAVAPAAVAPDAVAPAAVAPAGVGHAHARAGWGDCCGISVPSSVGAAHEARRGEQPLRRIPFD